MVIAISVVLGKVLAGFIAVGLTMWVEVARVTEEVLKIVQMPYIEAVKSLGLSDFRIMISMSYQIF